MKAKSTYTDYDSGADRGEIEGLRRIVRELSKELERVCAEVRQLKSERRIDVSKLLMPKGGGQ